MDDDGKWKFTAESVPYRPQEDFHRSSMSTHSNIWLIPCVQFEFLPLRSLRTFAATPILTVNDANNTNDLFSDYSARIQIDYLEPPISVLLNQNKQRSKPVPESVVLELLEKLEPPTITECHSLTAIGT